MQFNQQRVNMKNISIHNVFKVCLVEYKCCVTFLIIDSLVGGYLSTKTNSHIKKKD